MVPEDYILTFKKFEEKDNYFFVNGSYYVRLRPNKWTKSYLKNKKLRELHNYIVEFRKLKVDEKGKEKIKKEILKEKLKTTELLRKIKACSFKFKSYKELVKIKTKSEILFTHHPPLLKDEENVFGYNPDNTWITIKGVFLYPAYPDDPEAKKVSAGDKNIRGFIEKNDFKIVFTGHIHEGSGIAKINNTIVINPGSLEAYINKDKVLSYVLAEIKEKSVKVHFKSWVGEKSFNFEI